MNEIAIKAENLSKEYERAFQNKRHEKSVFSISKLNKEKFYALNDVNFEIKKGQVVGIIGGNGAGKSTLLKIISKITYPTKGMLTIFGKVASMLEVGTGFHSELTGRENIYMNGALLGMTKKEISFKLEEIIDFSGIEKFIDTQTKFYSSGMYVRLAFSVSVFLNSDIVLLDEVIAVGDVEFQKKCLDYVNNIVSNGKTILMVSHDLLSIQKYATSGFLLENGRILNSGPISEVCKNYLKKTIGNTYLNKEGSIRSAQVYLKGETIVIDVDYYFDKKPLLPNIGYVIYTNYFQQISGTNVTSNIERTVLKKEYNNYGKIQIYIDNLNLVNGEYLISLWLSNGPIHVEHREYCLKFSITNSIKTNVGNGPVLAQSKFIINGEF